MITVKQAAKILRLKPVTVGLLCRQGQIEGAIKVGRDWVIPDRPSYIERRGPGRMNLTPVIIRKCEVCDTQFRPTSNQMRNRRGRYCSTPCSYKARRGIPRSQWSV